jgi:hypothetical protein
MKKNLLISIAAVCGLSTLCSCHGDVLNVDAQEPEPTSVLHVFTRSADPTLVENVPTPVSLYVFNASNTCVGLLSDVTQNALVPVAGGTYDIYAVAGVDASLYSMPTKDEAQKTTPLTLKSEQKQGDLMTSHATVTVADAEEHNLTLSLTRAVSGVKQITIKKVPTGVTAVSVSVAPLYETLLLDGTYSGTNGRCTIDLVKAEDGTTWSFSEDETGTFLFPSVDKPTITVNFTTASSTTSYSYAADQKLEVNHKLTIDATYTEQAKLAISGTISGSEWGDDTAITFEFDENSATGTSSSSGSDTGGESGSGDTGSGDNTGGGDNTEGGDNTGGSETSQTVELPAVGSLYKGNYVLSVDETSNQILVFSSVDKAMNINPSSTVAETALATLNEELQSWTVESAWEWRIPTYSEVEKIVNQKSSISDTYKGGCLYGPKKMYCFDNNGVLSIMLQNSTTVNIRSYSESSTETVLRPVATVTVTASN